MNAQQTEQIIDSKTPKNIKEKEGSKQTLCQDLRNLQIPDHAPFQKYVA